MSQAFPPFTIEFEVFLDDVIKRGELVARVNPVIVRSVKQRIVTVCVLLAAISGLFFLTGMPVLRVSAWTTLVVGIPIVVWAGPNVFWSAIAKAQRRAIGAGTPHLGDQRWHFADEAIRFTSGLTDKTLQWATVHRLLIGKTHIGRYRGCHGSTQGVRAAGTRDRVSSDDGAALQAKIRRGPLLMGPAEALALKHHRGDAPCPRRQQ